MFSSCKKDYRIKCDTSKTIEIVLLEELKLDVSSDASLTFSSDNELYVTVTPDGIIKGKNVGEANITVSNSEQSVTLHVRVSLFEEPTFDFGASPSHIKSIHGEPRYNLGDTIFIYGSGNDWYSYAVWEMDFFFIDNKYFECDLYMRDELELRIDQFLDTTYFLRDTIYDTIFNQDVVEEISTIFLYINNENADIADVMVGKQKDAGSYDDICLFYVPFSNSKNDYKNILSRDRRRRE